MSQRESDTSIPIPEDELKKARLGRNRVNMSENLGFEEFQLAQKMKAKEYGKDLSSANEQDKKDILLVTLAEYLADMELGPEKTNNSGQNIIDKNSEKRNKIYDAYANACLRIIEMINIKYPGFLSVKSFIIDKGILSLFVITPPRTDIQMLPINLHGLFKKGKGNQIILDEKNLALELRGRAKDDLSKLRESLETESLFGGAVVITYEQMDTAKKTIPTALAIGAGIDITYRVKKLMFRDETGKMQEADPKIIRQILRGIGDKTRIKSMVFQIMRQTGRIYNPLCSAFTDMTTLAIDRATERVNSLKRSDIEQGRTMTDAEFEAEKQRVIHEISRMPKSEVIARVGKVIKSIPGATLQGVMYGVFFIDYQKHSYDTAQIYRGFAEAGLFEVGQAVGQRLAPGIWKIPASLVGGGLAILGGHALGGAIQLDKKVWRAFPERMVSDGSKSFVFHAITGGTINDAADRFNKDIGIPGTRGGSVLYNPFGKDGIMPNVDFAGTHITFGTDPRQYLQSRVGGTDIHWNTRMDQYISWATVMTMKILQEYDNNRGYFASSNGKKEELLRERLRHVFDSEDGANKRNTQIIEDCIDYIAAKLTKIKNLNSRKELLSVFLGNYGNILKIDKDSLDYDGKLLERDKFVIDGQRDMYLALLTPEKKAFAEKAFARLSKGERLIDGKTVTRSGDMIGQEAQVFMGDKLEISLYRSLIDDNTPAKEEWYDILGYREEPLNFQKGIKVPRSIVQLGGKNIYFDVGVSFLANDYASGMDKKDIKKIRELDRQYGLGIAEEIKKNPLLFQKNPFNGLLGKYFLLERLALVNPSIQRVLAEANNKPKPTNGDVFIYLLNTQTEYREQKRYIDTQKSLGYANKWKFF